MPWYIPELPEVKEYKVRKIFKHGMDQWANELTDDVTFMQWNCLCERCTKIADCDWTDNIWHKRPLGVRTIVTSCPEWDERPEPTDEEEAEAAVAMEAFCKNCWSVLKGCPKGEDCCFYPFEEYKKFEIEG